MGNYGEHDTYTLTKSHMLDERVPDEYRYWTTARITLSEFYCEDLNTEEHDGHIYDEVELLGMDILAYKMHLHTITDDNISQITLMNNVITVM